MLRNFVAFFLQMATEYRNNVSWQKNSPTIAVNQSNGVLGRPAIRSVFNDKRPAFRPIKGIAEISKRVRIKRNKDLQHPRTRQRKSEERSVEAPNTGRET